MKDLVTEVSKAVYLGVESFERTVNTAIAYVTFSKHLQFTRHKIDLARFNISLSVFLRPFSNQGLDSGSDITGSLEVVEATCRYMTAIDVIKVWKREVMLNDPAVFWFTQVCPHEILHLLSVELQDATMNDSGEQLTSSKCSLKEGELFFVMEVDKLLSIDSTVTHIMLNNSLINQLGTVLSAKEVTDEAPCSHDG